MTRRARLLAVPLLVALPVLAQEAPTGPGTTHLGTLSYLRLDRLTIVYPTGPGEDPFLNRSSASARARFLQKTMGVAAEVAADDAVTPEQLAGHLLLLGWSNRLLGTEKAPKPFSHSISGLEFVGIHEADPGLDLLFATPSPYNPEKLLAFWSRIDPERDRIMTLPAVGSDWALYLDFCVVRQGMFALPHAWPPRRDPDAEKNREPELLQASAREAERRTARFDISYDTSVIGPDEINAIGSAREAALDAAIAAVGPLPEGYRITLNVYADEDAKSKRTGLADAAHSIPASRQVFMVRRVAGSSAPHEEIHLVARQVYGPCSLSSLFEGLVVAVDGTYHGTDLDLVGFSLLDRKVFPSIDDLLDEETARHLPADVRYPAAGLLVKWIRDTIGRDALKRAYTLGEGSLASLARVIGKPAETIEPSFRQWLDARIRARQSDVSFLKAQQEARDRYLAGDYAGVVAAVKRGLEIRPDDPQSLFNLASAEMRTKDYRGAEAHLRRLFDLQLPTKDAYLATFAHYQLGRLFDIQGRRKDALAEYAKVLEMPDEHDAHRLAREAMEKPATPDSLD